MSKLLARIKADQLTARKNKDAVARSVLTTLIGTVVAMGKDAGDRDPTENEIIGVINSFIKQMKETITIAEQNGSDPSLYIAEKDILSVYLPTKIDEDTLLCEITDFIETLRGLQEVTLKQTGAVMAHLSAKYPNQFDKATASKFIREQLVL